MRARILLVDDDSVDRMAVRRGLRQSEVPVDVEELTNGQDALRALRENAYDCVFLDYLLPDMTGLEVLVEARAADRRTPIVILTGQGDEELAVELMKAGASDYMPKSLATPERIVHTLRNALRLHAAEMQAARAEEERRRLLVREQAARADAEAAHRRLLFLAEASTALADSLDTDLTLDAIATLTVPTLADFCVVELQDTRGMVRSMARRWDGVKRRFIRPRRERAAPLPRAARRYDGERTLDALHYREDYADLLEDEELAGALVVPLVARGRAIGAVTLGTTSPERPFTEEDETFLLEVARRAAIAVDNARLYEEAREAGWRLRQQLDLTRAITNSLAEGVCALDLQGRVTFLNPAAEAALHWRAEEAMGRPLHDLVHPDHDEEDESESCSLLASLGLGRLVRSDSDAFRRRDGTRFPVSYAMSPIVSDGRVIGTVLAFHDVTEQKRAEAELEESRRQMAMNEKLSALGTLVSGVAHELRTPLTYVANNVFLIRHRLEKAARETPGLEDALRDVGRFSTEAMEGIERINALVRDLRPFVNPEPGPRVPARVDEVVGGAVELFRATQRGRSIVHADLQETPVLEMDKGQIQRVVINLLLNAMEAMPPGGTIHVRTRRVSGGAEIEVEDHGHGLTEETKARLFDPFFTTKAEGTGLGLSITRGMVEAHGGVIRFHSEIGEGTTFVVFLPEKRVETPGRSTSLSVQ